MNDKLKTSFYMSGLSFVAAIILLVIAAFGKTNAIHFSKPRNSDTWSTSTELIQAFTYIPGVLGIFLFILTITIFGIALNQWIKT